MAKNKKKRSWILILSYIFIAVGVVILLLTFWPVAKQEVSYQVKRSAQSVGLIAPQQVPEPPDHNFSIVIPKIYASAKVFSDIDSQDPAVYLPALKKGVAQALGSDKPGDGGNVYIFAHSTDTFYNVSRYNAIFYLIGKLNHGDKINIYYNQNRYVYSVIDKRVVNPDDFQYLSRNYGQNTLVLQTCYPPGTTLKRLIVVSKLEAIDNL